MLIFCIHITRMVSFEVEKLKQKISLGLLV